MGVTYVMAQSRLLPMQDTAIETRRRPRRSRASTTLDDREFRDALKPRGIAYFASLNIGFDPKFIAGHPDLLPIDQFGRREEKTDWYIALPPDRRENIAHKTALLEKAVAALEPDGVHLGFIRWPGFWEIWLPDVNRSRYAGLCAMTRPTLERFRADTGIDVTGRDPIGRRQADRRRARECLARLEVRR